MRRSTVPVVVGIYLTTFLVPALLACLTRAQLYVLSPENIASFVDAHNQVRRNVNPPAKNPIPDVVWDTAVQASAENSARTCSYAHHGGNYGENLAWSTGYPEMWVEHAVSQWSRESKDYDISTDTCAHPCRHYTQLVWADSLRIGCARVQCDTVTYISCQYDPPGNWVGQYPYEAASEETISKTPQAQAAPQSVSAQELPSPTGTGTRSPVPPTGTGTGSMPQPTGTGTGTMQPSGSASMKPSETGTGTMQPSSSGTMQPSDSGTMQPSSSGSQTVPLPSQSQTGTGTGTGTGTRQKNSETGTATKSGPATGTATRTFSRKLQRSKSGTTTINPPPSETGSVQIPKSRKPSDDASPSSSPSGEIPIFVNMVDCKDNCRQQYDLCKNNSRKRRACKNNKKECIDACITNL